MSSKNASMEQQQAVIIALKTVNENKQNLDHHSYYGNCFRKSYDKIFKTVYV